MEDKAVLKEIGLRIREARIAQGMTQNDLAFAAHISTSNISDIELGKSNIWVLTFAKIVEALQISADTLLRTDTPVVNELYQKEFSGLLSDCSPSEMEAILKIVRQVKETLHAPKKDDDI